MKGQQDGLNRLTVEEFLENVANPIKRDPRAAKLARRRLQRDLEIRLHEELLETMSPHEAKVLAARKAKETMSTLAALHNPDLIAGGKDVITDFGDRQVNSTIGPQWKSKVDSLKRAAENAQSFGRKPIFLNVKLHKC
ncbi:hypothetical protein D3C75_581430 [compost metagenome]